MGKLTKAQRELLEMAAKGEFLCCLDANDGWDMPPGMLEYSHTVGDVTFFRITPAGRSALGEKP